MSLVYDYSNPTAIHFGKGQIASIVKHLNKDNKILVVYGGGSIKKNGVYDEVSSVLDGFNWIEFSGIEANPSYETLNKAVALSKAEKIDYILAVGGGSVIDGAKYIAAASLYDGDAWDFLDGSVTVEKALPLGAILTLPATGSESNGNSVVSKKETNEKRFFASPLVYPVFAVLDPSVMSTLSDRQLANGLVDAFVHTCEQYLTCPNTSLLHDGYAETILRGLLSLAQTWDNRKDAIWEENLMLLANQALNGFIGSGVTQDWATHMIGHELTGFYGVDHAQSLAVVQPQLLRVMMEDKKEKLALMGENVFGIKDDNEAVIIAIEKMYESVGVTTNLNDYENVDDKVIETIIPSLKAHGMTAIGENQNITLEVSEKILKMAMK
ncbi:iron-containing alcohol dehydrogenase [Poseidonibacter ostreae]|jgi:NADP-dependent alcohol dehydrogenase|uniref:Iron-containing alcohol dehydrogenase n=1 Tax=Poseidonibacter ostreae TaxID=2654171 RepID=A0A6L4WWW0_9BACT|nr:iron-containing alcohol dehydrogenase [Poseidonibacter ostreae]KAB7886505.1 iron-containing alcohol dehydrogenase [Poseidonibacter ostreae]KAB7890646.1 iron-containing alcohol dehydrogenase [Poseidonibacter ostreae]KAB7892371.1 iron-containing alcohol dehydrogenase [Poseidonibacter ostreae]